MEKILLQFGLSITANAVWDFLKTLGTLSRSSFKEKLAGFLGLQNDDEKMEKIITFLVKNNYIREEQDNKIAIILEDIIAKGDVIGFEGDTSNNQVKEIFKNNPMDITVRRVASDGRVIGMKLNVGDRAELKQSLQIEGDCGSAQFNLEVGKIIFGGCDEDNQ